MLQNYRKKRERQRVTETERERRGGGGGGGGEGRGGGGEGRGRGGWEGEGQGLRKLEGGPSRSVTKPESSIRMKAWTTETGGTFSHPSLSVFTVQCIDSNSSTDAALSAEINSLGNI